MDNRAQTHRGRHTECACYGARFWRRGEPQVWATAAALAGMLFLVFVLLAVVMVNGLAVFWPSRVAEVTLTDGRKMLGQRIRSQINPDTRQWSVQFKTGNRERDPQRQDFHWIQENAIRATANPPNVCVLERMENGDFYGRLKRIEGPDVEPTMSMQAAIAAVDRKAAVEIAPIAAELRVGRTTPQRPRRDAPASLSPAA